MTRAFLPTLLTGWLCLVATAPAQIVDHLNSTANFSSGFNGTTATANGDGTVTLTRTQSDIDAGIDWRPVGGTGFLSLDSEYELTLTPTATVNGGLYNVNILFWSINPSDPGVPVFLTEESWLGNTSSTSVQFLDVAQFATDQGVTGADLYFVRFRIDPYSYTGSDPGVTFTQLSALPEPASSALIAGAFALLALRRRRA